MTSWFHTAILATSLAAVVAVGLASATIYVDSRNAVAAKADRLPIATKADDYVTVETRQDGVSILHRIALD